MKSRIYSGAGVVALVALLVGLVANGVFARPDSGRMIHSSGKPIATPALSGYDPVAYFEVGRPVRGSGYHTATYEGVTYLFSNEDHRKQFQAHPEKYAPQYGGYCAYGVAVGKKFFADPNRWKIVSGKLYLNINQEIQDKWNQDTAGYIARANGHWPEIQHQDPADL